MATLSASLRCIVVFVALFFVPSARADFADIAGRVVEVHVEGLDDQANPQAIRNVFGVRPGDILSADEIRAGIRRIFLTGLWSNVQVFGEEAPGGWRLVLEVQPDLTIHDVMLSIADDALARRLRPSLTLSAGERFQETRVKEMVRVLQSKLETLGYPAATIETEVRPQGRAGKVIDVRISPGAPTRLLRAEIVGDAPLLVSEIQARLGLKEGMPFERVRLEAGLANIKALLLRKRHLRAAATIVSVAYDATRTQAEVQVRLAAGPRYRVVFAGNEVMPSAYLHTIIDERKIGDLSDNAIESATRRLQKFYLDAGFAHAKVSLTESDEVPRYLADTERTLRFDIDEGPRVEVKEIFVEGAFAQDGHVLSQEVAAFVRENLPELGLVERVDPGDIDELLEGEYPRDPTARGVEYSEQNISWLPVPRIERSSPFIASAYDEAALLLSDRYRKQGYLQVEIFGPELLWLGEGEAVRVRYRVQEGPQTRISAVRFVPAPTLPIGELLRSALFQPGDPADLYAIEETRLQIESELRARGYPFARVSESLETLGEVGSVEVHFQIEEGPRVQVGQVRVRGNKMTQDFVILDRVLLRSGQYYSERLVEQSRQRLLEMGLFNSVSIQFLDEREDSEIRDLLVEVQERHRFSVEAGVGASIEDGPRLFTAAEIRNIAGFGLGVRSRLQVNYPRMLYDFIYDADDITSPLRRFDAVPEEYRWALFTEGQFVLTGEMPKLYGLPFDVRLHLDAIGLREIRPTFTLMKASVVGGIDTQPVPAWRLTPQIEVESSDFDCLTLGEGCQVPLTRRINDSGTLAQATLRLLSVVDLRDDPFRPHSGFWASITTDISSGAAELRSSPDPAEQIGARTSNFAKVAAAFAGYLSLAPRFTWANTLRGGNIFPLDGDDTYVPPYKSFFLGGTGSVRGFLEDSILPADHAAWPAHLRDPISGKDAWVVNQGGNFFLNARSELRIEGLSGVELGTFIDVGQLAHDALQTRLDGWAIGAGFGVRYQTPVGPFAVDLGWKVIDGQRRLPPLLDPQRMNLHFSVGYF